MAILGPYIESIPNEQPLIVVEPIVLPEPALVPEPAGIPIEPFAVPVTVPARTEGN